MQKRILALLVSVLMVVSMLPTATFAADYSDTRGHWAETELSRWSDLGILKGSDGQFRPDAPITRGEIAVILDRVMKYQIKAENKFSDLGQEFYTDAVLKANASGIIKGDGKTVRPTDLITREEAAVMLGRALGTGESDSKEVSFSDKGSISSWAIGFVKQMNKAKYIKGMPDGSFSPKANITRAEVIKILDNAIKSVYNTAGTYSQDVNGSVIINTPGVTLKGITIKGDLIIAEGVGSGEVTLDSIKVEGKTIVRGGGENSIIIKGASSISNITIERIGGVVSVKVQGDAKVEVIYINDGSDDVNISGKVGNVEVKARDIVVTAVGATIGSASITGQSSKLIVDKTSNIEAIKVTSQKTEISVSGTVKSIEAAKTAEGVTITSQKDSVISSIKTEAQKTEIKGEGKVENVVVSGNNAKIDTVGTKIEVDKNANGTTSGGKDIAGGTSGTTATGGGVTTTTPPSTGGGLSGGGKSKVRVARIMLSPTSLELIAGGATGTLTAIVIPSNAKNKAVTWSSSNPSVATIADGVVTPVAEGKTYITVTTVDGGKTATIAVTVRAPTTVVKTALIEAISAANENKSTVTVSVYGSDVVPADKWVTIEAMTAYSNAISDAQAIADKADATQTEVDNAVTALGISTATFNNAKASGTKVTAVTLSRIELTTPPTKLIYTVGELLDISGSVVTATYSDNTTKVVPITVANVTGFDSSVAVASQTLTITVDGKTATYTVEIKDLPVITITEVSVTNATTVAFNSDVDGATIKWNDIAQPTQTVNGSNTITVPLMVSGQSNTLTIEKAGYAEYTKSDIVWTEIYNATATPGTWTKDRTEPKTWTESNGCITLTTSSQKASNSWYDWQGRGAVTNVGETDKWKVETQLELTDELLNGTGVRTSIWIQVDGVNGMPNTQNNVLDWAILQYKNDPVNSIKGWESWDSTTGTWIPINNVAAEKGVYTLTMIYDTGKMSQYINGILIREYNIETDAGFGGVSAPSCLIIQSRTFGAEYTAKWNVPTVSYVDKYPVTTKFISDVDQLTAAIKAQEDGQTWIIMAGDYGLKPINDYAASNENQTGWYFPITANNITINGIDNPILYGNEYTKNGNWSTQNLITIFGSNVKISGLTLMTKVEGNKTLEVVGADSTIEDCIIKPNTKVSEAMFNYFTDPSDVAFNKEWGGSLYYSAAGNHTVKNVTIYNAGISFRYSPANTHISFENVNIVYNTNIDDINTYRFSSGFNNPGCLMTGQPVVTYMVDTIKNNLLSAAQASKAGDTIILAAATYYVPTGWKVPDGVTLDKTTNNAIVEFLPQGTVLVNNVNEFNAALNGDATTILMATGTYTFDSQIRIDKAINIIGAGDSTIITKGSIPWTNTTGSKGYASLITIICEDKAVKLENIKVTGAANIVMTGSGSGTDYGSGINVVSSSNVTLNNVTSSSNAATGLIVNGSTVEAINLNTSDNGWGGVNVDPGSGVTTQSVFNLTGNGVLAEDTQIWSDGSHVNGNATVSVAADGYTQYQLEGTTVTIWSNKGLKNVASITKGQTTKYYSTIQAAVTAAAEGDTILLAAGSYAITDTINVNKSITIKGQPDFATIITTSGGNPVFNLGAAVTLESIYINKTDKANQHLITITADNVTVKGSKFTGHYVQGDNEVVRAIVPNAGISGYTISGNYFESVRQPAYLEGNGSVINNFLKNTRGWVVCVNYLVDFQNNTFEGNAVDIAIIANGQTESSNYSDPAALSKANNGAYVENQLLHVSARNGSLIN